MPLADRVAALATRTAQEFKAVRTEMAALGGGADPWTNQWISSAVTAPTTTVVDIHAGFTPAASTRYIIDALLMVTSINATTGVQVGISGPTTGLTRAAIKVVSAATASTDRIDHLSALNAWAVATVGLTTPTLTTVQAVLDFATPGAGNVRLSFKSENANSAVVVQPGSVIRWRQAP